MKKFLNNQKNVTKSNFLQQMMLYNQVYLIIFLFLIILEIVRIFEPL